jgi:hypothetical protein
MEAEMSRESSSIQTRTDFCTVVHKALRKRLFEAIVLAGASDLGDSEDRATLARKVAEVVKSLREHAEHEEGFIHPIIAEVMPEVAHTLHIEHEAHHRELDEVEHAFEEAYGERTPAAGHRAYRTLARFTAHFLAHMEEEEVAQPSLWDSVGETRMAAAMAAFKRSRSLEQTLAGFADMLPAMNAPERTAFFHALRAGAPEVVVAAAGRLAQHVLGAREWSVLRSSLQ